MAIFQERGKSENLRGKYHMCDLDVDGGYIKMDVKGIECMWPGFIRTVAGSCDIVMNHFVS
jgi:hypothetical protein